MRGQALVLKACLLIHRLMSRLNTVVSTETDALTPLYPDIEPYNVQALHVGAPHQLTVEESGNPKGLPVVFLHGGPGSHCKPYHRSFFDPARYRIILFDQRGSGSARPLGCLEDNSTQALIADLEAIRQALGIERWVLFGGSWGSTLALLYAEQHPQRCLGLILRGIFLARQQDMDWMYRPTALRQFFPQQWQAFIDWLPEAEQADPLPYYYRCLTGNDESLAQKAALQWAAWGGCVVSFGQFPAPTEFEPDMLVGAQVEAHYMMNSCFIEDNQILNNIEALQSLPAIIIHGQQDLICPLESAWLLHQHLPAAEFHRLLNSGHLASELAMQRALVTAADTMANWLAAR